MNLRRFFSLVGITLALGGGVFFSSTSPALAQADVALTQVGEEAQLGSADPQVIAGRLINIFLGAMGIVLLCLVLYAGFLWMTAGGDTEKVEKAQKTIRNAIIGLLIIACSWAFVSFVLKSLGDAVGEGDGVVTTGGLGSAGTLGAAGGSLSFQLRSITPAGPVRIRNVQVRFLLSREVLASTATSSIKVVRASDNQAVNGSVAVDGSLVTFVPTEACPAPNGARKCFAENTDYIAKIEPTLRSRSGLTIACGRNVPPCEMRFKTGSLIDGSAPTSTITTPLDGQGIPLGDTVRVTVRSSDDGGISLTDVLVDGRVIGSDPGAASSTPTQYDATVLWDTRGVATGTHRIEAHVWDVDSNSVTTTAVTVVIRPRNFFNGVQDGPGVGGSGTSGAGGAGGAGGVTGAGSGSGAGAGAGSGSGGTGGSNGVGAGGAGQYGETGVDCGGPSGGGCAGATCTRAYECASGMCSSGRCVEQPVIGSFSPADGRPGTFVTITGANFGTTPGQVTFGGRTATAPASCSASASSWSATQIVVAVPEGATTSSIQVTHGGNRLSDTTNDERGPRLADFRVSGVARPGLCTIRPGSGTVGDRARLAVAGVNLGVTAGQLYFNNQTAEVSAWRPTGIDLSAPLVPPGSYAVRARVGTLESNPITFQFNDRIITAPPTIDSLRPATGTVGSYVTLVGRNFGNAGRVFFRNPLTNGLGEADTRFPAQCGSGFWGDTAVMVKVPRALRGGLGEEQLVRSGRYEIYVQRDGITVSNRVPFTVMDGAPGPGICSIQPAAGPVGTGVTILGENFGTSVGSVTFAGSTSTRPAAFLTSESWREGEIRTRVPVGASTGMVRVSVAGQQSNDAFFSVASCVTSPGICGASLACCPDGSCAVGGVCQALSIATSTFAWRTSTGRIYQHPRVVEECNNEEPPSPSPRSLSTCVNAQAVVRFTTHIERSTISPSTVIVRRCTGTTGDVCATGTPEIVPGTLGFVTGLTQDHVVFTPAGNVFAPSSTYQIILTTGIRSTSAEGSRAMLENAELYGRGNAYAYRFRTKAASDLCTAGSVSVVPANWLMENIGDRKEDYTVSARASDDMCVQINGATLDWGWSLAGAPGRASIEPSTRDLVGAPLDPSRTDIVTVVGRGATDRDPVLVNVDLTRPAPPLPVRGTGRLTIRLTPPRVVSYAPNCNEACVNAAVWAKFNVAMDRDSLFRTVGGRRVPNVEIKRCTNESCRETDRTLDLSEAIIDLMTPAGTFATDTMMKIEPSILSTERDPETGGPVRTSQFEPGKFYTATIIGGVTGVRSAYGNLSLTELNSSDPVGFTWKFRVKTGPGAYCTAARVEVAPSQKYEIAFGMRQLFIASPISAPDTCSRDGQMLISERSTSWTSSDRLVADFVQIGGARSSVSLADRLPEFCTNQCLNAGSSGVFGRTATCGNNTVETTDTNFCRRRSDSTRACEVGNADCVTRLGGTCLLLPEGSQDAEECDNGTSNGASGECSAVCLMNPVRRVTDTPAGTCGNGSLQRGEQCDAGRVCVGGPTPGRDCTSDPASCGTGGACQVVERRGCSVNCQALGASRGGSTCGNGDVSDGETCDYLSGQVGSGCTDQCLHRGSSNVERRLCGNGRIEAGESCETPFGTTCNPQTCLNIGTSQCGNGVTAGCCGNNRVEAGEDCDGGAGCSARCLKLGSSPGYPQPSLCGDRVVGTGEQCDAPTSGRIETGDGRTGRFEITNRQLFEIVGLREPNPEEMARNAGRMASTIGARYLTRDGQATYGVQCNFSREADCRTLGTGLTSGGCCAVRPTATPYPRAGSTDVCRNVLITATFNQLMDETSVRGNFLVSSQAAADTCPTGTTRLDRAVPTAFNWSTPIRSFIALVKSWFAPATAAENSPWCVGTAKGTVVFEKDEIARQTTAALLLDEALAANTQYQVTLLGDPAILTATTSSTRRGLRGANGIYANGNISWRFTTGERVCTIDELRLTDTYAARPTIFYKSNEAHRYIGRAVSYHREEVVPLSPIRGLYDWAWREWVSARPSVLRTQTATTTPQISVATTTAQNQRGTSLIATGITITADRVNVPSTVSKPIEAGLMSTVLLCDNPWIPPGTEPGQPPRFEDSLYHFAFNYCLDANRPGPSDDLPELVVNRLSDNPSDIARGVKRQYIFSFSQPSFRSDALGLRVMSNPLHLSPKDWYLAQGFAGTPQATTVDGYEAIRDGSTLYISATNLNTQEGGLTTDMYVLSHNPNAAPETRSIFEQVVESFTFNTNLLHDADGICRTSVGGIFRHTTSSPALTCTADWECVRYDAGGYCASSKEKIQRDSKRMADFQYLAAQLEGAKARDGRYPTLNAGTFLQTFVTSRWPSWQSVFAATIGKALPEDPLNVNVSCGQCLSTRQACMEDSDCGASADRCVPVDGYDPKTCWNAASSTYRIPVLEPTNGRSVSRLYQYRSVDGGNRYELGTELEYLPIENYTPSVLSETRRCVSTNAGNGRVCIQDVDCNVLGTDRRTVIGTGVCTPQGGRLQFGGISRNQVMGLGGICGDGVVGTGEVCEPGQTRQNDCPIAGVAGRGRQQQVCQSDCSAYVDVPGSTCISRIQCGNGRVETGETCDDGDLNGRYGQCNRSCNGFAAVCGDGQLSAGETCDSAERNGLYCDTRDWSYGNCNLTASCSLTCREVAPHCGDGIVQTESIGDGGQVEQCDGNAPETTTSAVCSAGAVGQACDPSNRGADCAYGPISGADLCGRNPEDRSCSTIKVGLCAGGLADRRECSCPDGQDSCAGTTSGAAVCGATYRCVMYPTQRTRTCNAPSSARPVNQCSWSAWSACRPANFCGDGVLDAGERCDDGNRNDNDACTNRCLANVCGDGVMNVGAEECDYESENGQGCTGAEYGSTCGACTNQCRMTASSGGFCGNAQLDGSEQCDGTDFGRASGVQTSAALTCTGLGFDYAEQVRCAHYDYVKGAPSVQNPQGFIACTSNGDPTCLESRLSELCIDSVGCTFHRGSSTPEPVPTAFADQLCSGPKTDVITCGRTCGYGGCQTCSSQTGTASITAVVRDAVHSGMAVPGATVTLLQNGRRVTTQTTNAQGRFTFGNLNGNAACGGYRVYVEFSGNNPNTPDNEATNGGYWMYESNLFSVPTFEREGIQSSEIPGKIFLLPKVAGNETLVVHTWYGDLAQNSNRYLLSHLIMPRHRAYQFTPGSGSDWTQSRECTAAERPGFVNGKLCYRDIREFVGGNEAQGNPDLAEVPHARLYCSSGAGGVCFQVANSPQATRYRWTMGDSSVTGNFSYFLVDQRSMTGQSPRQSPSYQYYRDTRSTVWIVTQSRVYKVLPPATTPTNCQGKFWLVYQQDSSTGAITLMSDADRALLCGGQSIPGEVVTPALPNASWPTSGEAQSWMAFGGWGGGEASPSINWDPFGVGPAAR
jgi:cysteine-rich repeat protein